MVQGAYYDLLMSNWTMFLWAVITLATSLGVVIVVDGSYELFVWIVYLIDRDEIKQQEAEYKLSDKQPIIPVIRNWLATFKYVS